MPGEQAERSLTPPAGPFAVPSGGPIDEPPPHGVAAAAPSGRLRAGFWPVPCLLVADDGGARLQIAVSAGTTVHAIVPATVRPSIPPVVEIEAAGGRRFRYTPVAGIRVAPGQQVAAGSVLGTVLGQGAARLELAVREPDGRWVDPYPLLVGLADPNELGVDALSGDGVDPDAGRPPAPGPAPPPKPVAGDAAGAPGAAPSSGVAAAGVGLPPPPPVAAPPERTETPPATAATVTASPETRPLTAAATPAAASLAMPAPAAAGPEVGAAPEPPAAPPEPPAPEAPRAGEAATPRVPYDILAAMVAPTPPAPEDEPVDD